jgi:hypothetical protein
MHRPVFLILLCCSTINNLFAQQKIDSLRAHYIQEYPNHFFIWPVVKYRSLSFEVRDADRNRNKVLFRPNNAASLGVGLYLFEIGIELTFAVPVEERAKEIYGKTKARDLQLNVLTKSWGIDLYRQRYTGFYKDDTRVKIPASQPYPQRPDIETRNFGVSGVYVLNNKKFSLRSAYNYAERQLRSEGSFIGYGTLNSFKLNADSSLLGANTLKGFGIGADFKDLRYTTLSIAPGYSYTLTVNKVFINGTLTIGPAHHWVYFRGADDKDRYDISFNATYSLRLAAGYNSDRIFGGLGLVVQSRVVKFEDVRFENSSQTLRFLIGYRFRERGILEKRAWDFFPVF